MSLISEFNAALCAVCRCCSWCNFWSRAALSYLSLFISVGQLHVSDQSTCIRFKWWIVLMWSSHIVWTLYLAFSFFSSSRVCASPSQSASISSRMCFIWTLMTTCMWNAIAASLRFFPAQKKGGILAPYARSCLLHTAVWIVCHPYPWKARKLCDGFQ